MDLTRTESTRYLCAAAYLDLKFRRWLHEHVIDDEHHAIGRPAGVDLASVVKHCLAAEKRQFRVELVFGALVLVLAYLVLATPELRSIVGLTPRSTLPHPTGAALVLCLAALIAASAITVVRDQWDLRFRILGRDLSRAHLRPDTTGIELPASVAERLATASDDPANNTVVYSGYAPFVGAGVNVGGWSFAVNISKAKDDLGSLLRNLGEDSPPARVAEFPRATLGFDLAGLYTSIDDAIARLELAGISLRDQLYVNGRTIRDDRRFLDNAFARPRTRVDTELMKTFVGALAQPIRHYKVIEASTWSGELVLSIFLRFGKIDQSLFMETSYHLLTPVHNGYRTVDAIPLHPTSRQWMPVITGALLGGPVLMVLSPLLLLGRAMARYGRWQHHRELRRTIEDDPQYDYGTATTVREFARSQGYHQYFQQLDKDMYLKIIERQILDTTVDFLDRHNVDTSDLRQRQTTILNNGVVAGSVQAGSMAVGAHSTAQNSGQSSAPLKAA